MSDQISPERLQELRRFKDSLYGLRHHHAGELFAHIDALTKDRDKWEKVAISRRKERDDLAGTIERVQALCSKIADEAADNFGGGRLYPAGYWKYMDAFNDALISALDGGQE